MRQFNIEIDKTSPKTSRFVVPASEHFSILVRYKNWEDKQEWLDYTLVDDAGTDIVKYKKEAENDSVLYFCGIMDKSTNLRFKTSTLASTLAPRDTMQVVAIASSSQDNCYICSADYARTTGEGGGGGGVSEEYVDGKVQEEATARQNADEALRADIPTKTSQLSNDSGFLTKAGTIDNALSADFASSTSWNGIADKPIASATQLGLVKVGSNLTIDADGKLNATGGGTGGVSQEYVDGKVQEEATARASADEALRADIPTKTSELSNDSGYLTKDATTLSVAFGGLAKKITPKDVISFSSLTWQGTKHELGSKDYGVFDGNFQLDEAFWPAKPLPGYLYIECCNIEKDDTPTLNLVASSDDSVLTSFIVSNSMAIKLPSDGFNVARFSSTRGLDNYDFSFVTYNHVQETINVVNDNAIGINPANNSLQSYTLIIKNKYKQKNTKQLFCYSSDGALNLNVDSVEYSLNMGYFFIPMENSIFTNNTVIYARFIENNTIHVMELNAGQTYWTTDFGNASIIAVGAYTVNT